MEKRFVVKKVPLGAKQFVEWYNFSEISDMGIDRVDFVDSSGNRTLIFKSSYISDVAFNADTIEINWWKRQQISAINEIEGYQIKIDSGGCSFMSSSSRRTLGKNWQDDICVKYLKAIEFQRAHPAEYADPK